MLWKLEIHFHEYCMIYAFFYSHVLFYFFVLSVVYIKFITCPAVFFQLWWCRIVIIYSNNTKKKIVCNFSIKSCSCLLNLVPWGICHACNIRALKCKEPEYTECTLHVSWHFPGWMQRSGASGRMSFEGRSGHCAIGWRAWRWDYLLWIRQWVPPAQANAIASC